VLVYLEDLGPGQVQSLQAARDGSKKTAAQAPEPGAQADYEAVWQLEMWKRAEEAKFKAYLKQREIEKIQEITYSWKIKEADRETTFNDAMKNFEGLETKLR
jgi:centrosomal protein CEP120